VDATQFFSLTNQISPVAGESLAAAPAAKVEGLGSEFADLFKAQIQLQVRQEFAAPVEDQVELQVLPLGPTINLITPNSPLPDMFSLASFARAQGLDDEAVKTLFGQAPLDVEKKTVDPLQVSGLILPDAQIDPFYLGAADSVSMSVVAERVDIKKTDAPLQVSELILPAAQFDPIYLGAADSVLVPVVMPPYLGVGTFKPTSDFHAKTFDHLKTEISAFKAVKVGENLVDVSLASKSAKLDSGVFALASKVRPEEVSLVSVEIDVLPQTVKISSAPISSIGPIAQEPAAEVAISVLRVRLEAPSEAVTQKLSEISGSKETLNWRALLASAALTGSSKVEISPHTELLTLEVPPDLLADLEDASADNTSLAFVTSVAVSGDSTKAPAPTGDAGDMAQNPSAEHRNEQYQQVADRLGRAVAEKLMAQIERGEWKMQLRLQPESLGRIDVALEMHSGGLDALFSAENGATRDLIAQGSGKLRDALTQSGMAVASVFVNGDQGRKSDGNPTSGRPFKGGTSASQDDEDDVMPVTNVGKRISSSTDGLDVLA
jgi:hypothetical protein